MGPTAALVDGIETIQVLYGVDTNNDLQVDSYSDYTTIAAASNTGNILSAKIGFMINSGQVINSEINSIEQENRTLTVLGESFNRNDRIARSTLTTSIQFPNLPLTILP